MSKHRIPRKEIVMRFKDGRTIDGLVWDYRDHLGSKSYADCFAAIVDIIRRYMRRQDKK